MDTEETQGTEEPTATVPPEETQIDAEQATAEAGEAPEPAAASEIADTAQPDPHANLALDDDEDGRFLPADDPRRAEAEQRLGKPFDQETGEGGEPFQTETVAEGVTAEGEPMVAEPGEAPSEGGA
jgi:hypothetical protein